MREGMEMSAEFGGKIMEQAIGSAFVYAKEKNRGLVMTPWSMRPRPLPPSALLLMPTSTATDNGESWL